MVEYSIRRGSSLNARSSRGSRSMKPLRLLSSLLFLALIGCGEEAARISAGNFAESTKAVRTKPSDAAATEPPQANAPGTKMRELLRDGAVAALVGTQAGPAP